MLLSFEEITGHLKQGAGHQRLAALLQAPAAVLSNLRSRGAAFPVLWETDHFRHGQDTARQGHDFIVHTLLTTSSFNGSRQQYLEILEGGLPSEPLKLASATGCFSCGGSVQGWVTHRGLEIRTGNGPCPFPSGILSEVEVEFPTGRIIFSADLQNVFPELEAAIDGVRAPRNVRYNNVTAAMAPLGLAAGFCGPLPCSVFAIGKGLYGVGRGLEGKEVAPQSSSLWWWGLTDAAHMSRTEALRHSKLTLEPGRYRFSLDVHADPLGSGVELARFERVS